MEEELIFRLIFIGVIALVLSLSTYYRRLARKSGEIVSRRREGALALILRAVMTMPMLLAILLNIFLPHWMAWSKISLPVWVRWLGAGLGIALLPLLWWVFSSIGSNISETVLTKREHRLVMEGPYRWVRHPLYGGALLEILALSMIASNWFMALLWLIGVLVFRYVVIPIEEAKLIAAFNGKYEQYRARTGALAPRF
ncbi:MAG TPA: isoprenylcysteine carboxylmethyltransferase family protein [Blastocatellia bacterium]|nr:isoprenylcysteine carboxylmethyltransferase family protein [Blastocatellia bacterium]